MEGFKDERVKHVVIGASLLTLLAVTMATLLLGWRYIPGLLGEWIGTAMGILTTPFFLEGSFMILGLITVVTLNTWRRHRDGDEFVYLEQVSGPDVPADMPERSKWAIYRDRPLNAADLSPLEAAQGALAVGDYQSASDILASFTQDELQKTETLRLRIDLARATGKEALAKSIESKLPEA